MTPEREIEILSHIQKEPELFGEIFDAHYDTIFTYVLKRVDDASIAGDIVSDTFFKALRNISKFQFRGIIILHWLYRIASNEIALYFRNASHGAFSLDEILEQNGFEPVSETNIEEEYREIEKQLELQKDFKIAQKKLLELPVKYQEVITLRFLEEKSIKEISLILEKPEGTIKSLISRGTELLERTFLAQKNATNFSK